MMLLSKLKVGLGVLLSMGFATTGTVMLAAQGQGQKEGAKPGSSKPADVSAPDPFPVAENTSKPGGPFRPRSVAELAKVRVDQARRRLDIQWGLYEERLVTIDRLADASRGLMQAERDASDDKAVQVKATMAHLMRLKRILKRETDELEAGRATESDVAEAQTALLEAEFALAKDVESPEAKAAAVPAPAPASTALSKLAAERVEIARRIFENSQELYRNARIELSPYLDACQSLLVAEEAAATTKAERIRVVQEQIKSLKNALAMTEAQHQAGRATVVSVDRVRLKILDAEAHLIEVSEAPEGPGVAVLPTSGGNLPTIRAGDPKTPGGSAPGDEWVATARKTYESLFDEVVELFVAPPAPGVTDMLGQVFNRTKAETFYLWSRRWMEAQRDGEGGSKAAEVAAIEGHLGRMRDLERGAIFKAMIKRINGKPPTDESLAAEIEQIPQFQTAIKFYRLEAEAWLAKAKAR